MFGKNPDSAFYHKKVIPTVKHGGGSITLGCLAAAAPGQITNIDGLLNSEARGICPSAEA